jgi:hypothetical protein
MTIRFRSRRNCPVSGAVVLADHAIAEKVDAKVWQELVDLMIQGIGKTSPVFSTADTYHSDN